MEHKVLVTFASKHGSTREIAYRIEKQLKDHGIQTDFMPVREVQGLQEYTAVILGSAVYVGQWRRDARKFLKKYRKTLKNKEMWIFSTGPTGEGDPASLLKGWIMPSSLIPVADEIGVREITVFHGNLDTGKLSGLQRSMIKKVEAPVGDFRDWKMIDEWGKKIASSLS